MYDVSRVWCPDWRARLKARLESLGSHTMTEFLGRVPSEPYLKVAQMLGEDVAALQLEWMQFEEAREQNTIRYVAMDSLARELKYHLPTGWRYGAKGDFDTASVYADWIVRLEQYDRNLKAIGKAVWQALEERTPPVGWSPSGPEDRLLVAAFAKGWPV